MNQDLQGKTAVVTGGSKGIGYAVAESLAAAGINVMISARNETEVQQAARTLSERNPGTVEGVVCDVRKHEDVKRMISATVERFGTLDVLANNAGVGKCAPMGELTPDDWHSEGFAFWTNWTSAFGSGRLARLSNTIPAIVDCARACHAAPASRPRGPRSVAAVRSTMANSMAGSSLTRMQI